MHDIIDLDRYPLDRPGTEGWTVLVDRCRAALVADGMFNLPGFLRAGPIAADVARLSPRFETDSFRHARRHNIYFRRDVPGLAPDHPALVEFETNNRTLCADQLTDSNVIRLYDWAPFADFLAAAMSKPALYTMDDALARLNVMSYAAGETLNWHFDRSEFTTTLMLQAPQQGGDFEYRSDLRRDDDPNYEGVARLLAGQDAAMKRITLSPGTLNVFRGKNTAHRVTTVQGATARMIAVFSFYDRPGVRFTPDEQRGFYGRAA